MLDFLERKIFFPFKEYLTLLSPKDKKKSSLF